MLHKLHLAFLLAALLSLHVFSPAVAALLLLPNDAVVEIGEFSFPASIEVTSETALPETFRDQLSLALTQAGILVLHKSATSAPLVLTPFGKTTQTPHPFIAVTPLPEESGEHETSEAADDTHETEYTAEDILAGDAPALSQSPPAEPLPRGATHILEGTVTLFRENVGTPTRIGGAIRIRTESQIHYTYEIRDVATGKVLISDVSSGSAVKLTNETQDLDMILHTLNAQAVTTATETMAANLSGKKRLEGIGTHSREYYQDSPGKRLKQ